MALGSFQPHSGQSNHLPAVPNRRLLHQLLGLSLLAIGSGSLCAKDSTESVIARIQVLAELAHDGSVPVALRGTAQTARELLQADLGEALPVCGELDPRAGVAPATNTSNWSSGSDQHSLLIALGELLSSKHDGVRDSAAFVLGEIGPAASGVVAVIDVDDLERPIWFSHALGRIGCQQFSLEDPVNAVSAALRAQAGETHAADEQPWRLRLAALLIEDRDRIWPDAMIASLFGEYEPTVDSVPAPDKATESALFEIIAVVADSTRDHNLRLDLLGLLGQVHNLGGAADPLLELLDDADDDISAMTAYALSNSRNPHAAAAVVVLLQRHSLELFWTSLGDDCKHQPLINAVLERMEGSDWVDAKEASKWLSCVDQPKVRSALVAALDHPSWEVQLAAVDSLGRHRTGNSGIRQALETVANSHWSGLLRERATVALASETPPANKAAADDDGDFTLPVDAFVCFSRCLTDHLNPSCSINGEITDGIYSSKRLGQFNVLWQRARRFPTPDGFPAELPEASRFDYGTNTFLGVDDGWLVGTDRWHYDGLIGHISSNGEAQNIGHFDEDAVAILNTPQLGRIVLGGALFNVGQGGLLASIEENAKEWTLRYRTSLPSPPWAWAFAPDGTLLIADPYNVLAVHGDLELERLSCPKIEPGDTPRRLLKLAKVGPIAALPVRVREAGLDAQVIAPMVAERRQRLIDGRQQPDALEPGNTQESLYEDFASGAETLIVAYRAAGLAERALEVLSDPPIDSVIADGEERAYLLAAIGQRTAARSMLEKHRGDDDLGTLQVLVALDLLEGQHERASVTLRKARSVFLSKANQSEAYSPYLEILRILVNDSEDEGAARKSALDADTSWPQPLIEYLEGGIGEPELVRSLYLRDATIDPERLCEALVYVGIRRATLGDRRGARRHFHAALPLGLHDFIEQTMALLALE